MTGTARLEPPSIAKADPARRAPWMPPKIVEIRAGQAEAGASGAIPDGPYAPGS